MGATITDRYAVKSLVNAHGQEADRRIIVREGRIDAIEGIGVGSAHRAASAHYAVPGFVDVHTNGGSGCDVSSATAESLAGISRYHLRTGTTAYVGTMISAPLGELRDMLARGREYLRPNQEKAARGLEATLLGFHLEGPWISRCNAGAHDPLHIRAPDQEAHELVRDFSDVLAMVTFSFHHDTAAEFLDTLKACAIVPALGHDETDDGDALEAFARGVRVVTHIYSSSSSFHRRGGLKHLGTQEMALMTPGVFVEIIADGYHITNTFWRFIRHNKAITDIVIISDSISAAGLPEDPARTHRVGGVEVVVDGGVAWLPDRSVFAGSVSSLHSMFVRLVTEWGERIHDAVAMTSANPARILGREEQCGSITVGGPADFLLLDEDLGIVDVVKSGRRVLRRPG